MNEHEEILVQIAQHLAMLRDAPTNVWSKGTLGLLREIERALRDVVWVVKQRSTK